MKKTSVPYALFVHALGQTCVLHRNDLGLSQRAFAHEIGIDPSTYQVVEAGRTFKGELANPTARTLMSIADGFGLTLVDLVDESWELAETL
ncbi:XRE family transcriptional regulator [Flaviflexus salsibiostraticola]|uniref:XRE family transcriptional regulator n=1 Tax=Flaviflexus salsibiostraticola TaxID=1282737 RepID=A0A3S8Z6R1_9ACTO|nr:helix-turn-helix transcriptional regulator [Flaviflexus salsibiostraticola]AZN29124.1 XRE family transcriptional regulator [Flaviflexus salsibiostraticola]